MIAVGVLLFLIPFKLQPTHALYLYNVNVKDIVTLPLLAPRAKLCSYHPDTALTILEVQTNIFAA